MNQAPRASLRLGVVAYLNMQPLVYGLNELAQSHSGGIDLEIRTGPPSALADWLAAGEIDAGMVPVASMFAHPEWSLMAAPAGAPALASMIGARGAVQSVLVVAPAPASGWQRLRLDAQSMTSNALAQILLREAKGLRLEIEHDEAGPADSPGTARVLIGSNALEWQAQHGAGVHACIDLGALWREWTGLPFTFAVWAVRPGVELGDWPARLEELKRTNRARIPTIAAAWPRLREEGLTPQAAADYLTHNIDFDFDADARAGLLRFYELGVAHGLFPPGWRLK